MMKPYAVVETGGKQYRVGTGELLKVEHLKAEAGVSVDLSPVLAVSNGTELRVGTPALSDAKVTAQVVRHLRGPKLVAFNKRRRKGYSRKVGHRQELTEIKIETIQ